MSSWQERIKAVVQGEFLIDESLANYSTMKVGGTADAVFIPKDKEDLMCAIKFAIENKIKFIVLGKGSNTLVRDGGVRGLVIILNDNWSGYSIKEENNEFVFVEVLTGTKTDDFTNICIDKGWSGFEALSGIPGTIGGNVSMNAGTKYGVIGDIIESVQGVDKLLNERSILRDKLELGYRKIKLPRPFVLTSVILKLKKVKSEDVASKVTECIEERQEMQPWELPSLGSVFKRPSRGYAGQLIEEAGLKCVRVGGARISEKHAGFILNEGNATAKDVLVLIGLIKDKVKQCSGVNLEIEIIVIGEDKK
ncbi:UDP-N-acetylmuramate dehydrogenase [bacterium]|nr:UDP-N-acetylmuramate dehydrogenase [bacterium]